MIRNSFNPCRVFSGLATSTATKSLSPFSLFQSLSGFFRPCNFNSSARAFGDKDLFQSLSGFFRPCNIKDKLTMLPISIVSIPVGFFQALQRQIAEMRREMASRFNPCRVFSGLATYRCWLLRAPYDTCFNPCRVFSGLATPLAVVGKLLDRYVSIPVGFFQALQPRS